MAVFFLEQVETLCNYHVGETVLSLQKATLIPGGSESLVFTTLSGGIGMLVPFTSREVQHPSLRHLFVIHVSCLFCLFIFFSVFLFICHYTKKCCFYKLWGRQRVSARWICSRTMSSRILYKSIAIENNSECHTTKCKWIFCLFGDLLTFL